MTEIKERIQELNKTLQEEMNILQKIEGIINETKNKIIAIRGGIAELIRIQNIMNKKVIDVVIEKDLPDKNQEEDNNEKDQEEVKDEK